MQDAVGLQGRGPNKVAASMCCKILPWLQRGAGSGYRARALCNGLTAPVLNEASPILSKLACIAYDSVPASATPEIKRESSHTISTGPLDEIY